MSDPINVTRETCERVKDWEITRLEVERLERRLEELKDSLQAKAKRVGEWLLPADADVHEKFHIWFGDGILEAQRLERATFLSWRKEMSEKNKTDFGMY